MPATPSADDQYLTLYRRWWLTTERRSPETIDHYLRELRHLQNAVDTPLINVDRFTLENWIADRTDRSAHNGRFAYRASRSFYRWAVTRELVDVDPTDKIPAPREVKNPAPTTVTDDDVATILATIGTSHPRDLRDRAIIEVLWSTGMRRGELLRMELHHVDLEDGLITLPITKTKRPRVAPLTPRALDALLAWLDARLSWKPGEMTNVWLSRWQAQTKPLSANACRLMLERRRRDAGVHLSAHAFRRGAAAHMLRSGMSQVSVENVLGWAPGSPMAASYVRAVAGELSIEEFRSKIG